VAVAAVGDRVLSREEIVELADAVAAKSGIASGIGTTSYGARLIVDAPTADEAAEAAKAELVAAAQQAGLPAWPVTSTEVTSEGDELGWDG
jgi:hypothetical protein